MYAWDVSLDVGPVLDGLSITGDDPTGARLRSAQAECARDRLGDARRLYDAANPQDPADLLARQRASLRACIEAISPAVAASLPDDVTVNTEVDGRHRRGDTARPHADRRRLRQRPRRRALPRLARRAVPLVRLTAGRRRFVSACARSSAHTLTQSARNGRPDGSATDGRAGGRRLDDPAGVLQLGPDGVGAGVVPGGPAPRRARRPVRAPRRARRRSTPNVNPNAPAISRTAATSGAAASRSPASTSGVGPPDGVEQHRHGARRVEVVVHQVDERVEHRRVGVVAPARRHERVGAGGERVEAGEGALPPRRGCRRSTRTGDAVVGLQHDAGGRRGGRTTR